MAEARREIEGNRLKRERERHKWTQGELAAKINGSERSIRRWEKYGAMLRHDIIDLLITLFGKPPEEWGNTNPRWNNVPFLRNRYFTGRMHILQNLHDALAPERVVAGSQAQAISGLAGIGKTATAIEYAYRYAEEYEAVLWVRADSETLVSDFAGLASVLELLEREERDQSRMVEAVKRWLQQHNSWLLIFDNADDLKRVFEYLPGRARGAVLLTTRSQATGSYIENIEMEKMSRKAGITFLLRRQYADQPDRLSSITPQEREEAGELWEALKGLPLALDQAAAYLEETHCTLSGYLALFKTRRRDLLKRRGGPPSEHPASVAATWLITLKKMERDRSPAAQLLRFCAFLHPAAIPESLFTTGADALWPVLQRTVADTYAWNEAIAELHKYSLVKRDDKKKILTIHGLVQDVIQDDMPQKAVREWAERAMRVVSAAFPESEPGTWSQCDSLLSHALLAARYIEAYHFIREDAGRLLSRMASYLHDRARYAEAESFYLKALHLREQGVGKEHLDVAASLDGLATLYRDWGRYAEAESLYQRALSLRQHHLGTEHLDVATSLEGLAILYREQGKFPLAEPLHKRVLAIREQLLGPEHLQVADSLHLLATLYKEQGRYVEAEQLHKGAIAIRTQKLGSEHPKLAPSFNNLGILYLKMGRYDEAVKNHKRALAIREKAYGKEHPDTATSMNNLAAVYYEQGNYTEVAQLFVEALRILEKHLGEMHPHVARLVSNLGEIYAILGQYEKAEPFYLKALHIWEQVEPEHPDGTNPLLGLANLYRKQGRYEEAERLYQRAMDIRQKTQGAEHPDTSDIMHHLALLREAQGNHEEARMWYMRALIIREQALGIQHPDTTATRRLLIALLRALGQHEEAAQLEAMQAEPPADQGE